MQSSLASQNQPLGMHCPLEQVNSSGLHVFTDVKEYFS